MGNFTLFSCWFDCYVFIFILLQFYIIWFNNCCLVFCLFCDFNLWFIFLSFADFNGCRSIIFWLSKWVHLAFVWKKLLTFMLIWLISRYIGNVVSHWFVCMATNGVVLVLKSLFKLVIVLNFLMVTIYDLLRNYRPYFNFKLYFFFGISDFSIIAILLLSFCSLSY